MLFGRLAFIFEVMIYVGLGLPLLHLLVSVIGAIGEGSPDVDADIAMESGLDAAELEAPDFELDLDAGEVDFDADGIDLEAPDMDAGTAAPSGSGFLPRFNLHCLCLAFVVMGAIGIFALETLTGAAQTGVLIAGAVLSAAAYLLLYRFVIWPLKSNKASALHAKELRFRHARVIFRLTRDEAGTIETRDATGALITYRAQMDPDICKAERIDEGEEVIVTDIDPAQNLCYVTLAQRKILK